MGTITTPVNLDDFEDFKQPTDGNHSGNLQAVEFGPTKKGLDVGPDSDEYREQFLLTIKLADDDPDAPGLPMRYYIGWPVAADKDVMWGTRTAYGSKIKTLKDALTAFGGPESGAIDQKAVEKVFFRAIGKKCKVKIKTSARKDTGELQAGIDGLYPA